MEDILNFFPKNIAELLYKNINGNLTDLEEIRIRREKPIILQFYDKELIIPYLVSRRRNY